MGMVKNLTGLRISRQTQKTVLSKRDFKTIEIESPKKSSEADLGTVCIFLHARQNTRYRFFDITAGFTTRQSLFFV